MALVEQPIEQEEPRRPLQRRYALDRAITSTGRLVLSTRPPTGGAHLQETALDRFDQALDVLVFPDFVAKVQAALPSTAVQPADTNDGAGAAA